MFYACRPMRDCRSPSIWRPTSARVRNRDVWSTGMGRATVTRYETATAGHRAAETCRPCGGRKCTATPFVLSNPGPCPGVPGRGVMARLLARAPEPAAGGLGSMLRRFLGLRRMPLRNVLGGGDQHGAHQVPMEGGHARAYRHPARRWRRDLPIRHEDTKVSPTTR